MPANYTNGFAGGGMSFGEGRRLHATGDYHVPAPIGQIGVARSDRSQHDSLVESNLLPRSPYAQTPRSPLAFDYQPDKRRVEAYSHDGAVDGSWTSGGRTPTSIKSEAPGRYESYSHLHSTASPLTLTDLMDEEDQMEGFTHQMRHSNHSSPNLHADSWMRPESRPDSGLASPTIGRAMEYRSSSNSSVLSGGPALPGPPPMRLRGMTASSAHLPSLHHSASLADLGTFRNSNRTLPPNVYRPSRGPSGLRDSAQSSATRREPFVVPFAEENRSSVRSAWTAASSGFLGSERSSVMSQMSSASDIARGPRPVDDLILSVEDAINMYSVGFTDDLAEDTLEDGSQDTGHASSYEAYSDKRDYSGTGMLGQNTYEEAYHEERTPVASRGSRSQRLQPPRSPLEQRTPVPQRSPLQQHMSPPEDADSVSERPPSSSYDTSHHRVPDFELNFELPSDNSDSHYPPEAQNAQHSSQHSQVSEPPGFSASPMSPVTFSQPPTPLLGETVPKPDMMPRSISDPSDELYLSSSDDRALPKHQDRRHPSNSPDTNVDSGGYEHEEYEADDNDASLSTWPLPPRSSPREERWLDSPPSANRQMEDFMNPRSAPARPPPPVARDRYGFKKVSQYIDLEQYDRWNKGYVEYLDNRKLKWDLLMKQYGLPTDNPVRFPPKTEKVKRYIRKGIPPEWRGAAWFWYAGGPGQLVKNSGLYQKLMRAINRGKLSDSDREHIERDLNRTFPDNVRFKPDSARRKRSNGEIEDTEGPDTPIVGSLRRVLQAFAVHNPNIGYCQSLNFLAGLLLLFLDEDEEKAFIMLNVITAVHLPGTHAKVLEANVDIGVLMLNIKESMPAIWSKIDDSHEDMAKSSKNTGSIARLPTVSLATTAWFMSCFIGNLPIETVLRVWDVFFYEGSKALFRIALTIFKVAENDIKNVTEHMEVFQLVQTVPRRLVDANELMEACYKRRGGFGHISQETIDLRRVERRKLLAEERARKLAAANKAAQAAAGPRTGAPGGAATGEAEEDRSSRLRRVASRAKMKRSQSKKRPQITRPAPAPSEELFDSGYVRSRGR